MLAPTSELLLAEVNLLLNFLRYRYHIARIASNLATVATYEGKYRRRCKGDLSLNSDLTPQELTISMD